MESHVLNSMFGILIAASLAAPIQPEKMEPPQAAGETTLSAADESVLALEKSVWDAEKNGDATRVAKRLAPDFVQIETSGIIDRTAALKQVAGMRLESYTLSNVKVLRPSTSDVAIVTFEFVQKSPGEPESRGYAASTWVNRSGVWLNALYVGVPKR